MAKKIKYFDKETGRPRGKKIQKGKKKFRKPKKGKSKRGIIEFKKRINKNLKTIKGGKNGT